ncbi:helix-turn-helix domain-containing protein [Paraburkholderia sediminicola]|uniref:helix-turn-helix domain-containing protein n=1 Tax=Paraburkholderia sediminicola TaxID=458836 RepID=UPI0038B98431
MKCVIDLSEAEDKTLHRMSLNHQHRDMRIRAAGVMMLGRKIKPTEIALQLGVSGQSDYNWAHAWRESGIGGLLVDHKGGRPRSLSEATIATAIEVACNEFKLVCQQHLKRLRQFRPPRPTEREFQPVKPHLNRRPSEPILRENFRHQDTCNPVRDVRPRYGTVHAVRVQWDLARRPAHPLRLFPRLGQDRAQASGSPAIARQCTA